MSRRRVFGGRPPLPKETVRSKRIVTFFTRDEYDKLLVLASEQGKSLSATCHDLIVQKLGNPPYARP